ncbi:MAG: nucleotidyltransferase domain-containing protein [Cyanobacteria bacterium P01_F01_bin.150]
MSPPVIALERFPLTRKQLAAFCQKWQIIELSLFGSILRDDFHLNSDIDVLVTFAPSAPWTMFDLVAAEQDLATLVNRDVDLLEKRVIEKSRNPIRKAEILQSAQVIYSEAIAYEPA